jgi:predicted O-linked N-acetylglucosamine transferase (SPINDLY family)/glycosyltransferase involved in cell wall biosynthesis
LNQPLQDPFDLLVRGKVGPREPLVSIFCFCKDRASTIRRCVESVLAQTYRNIEFVIQDGASTDGTLEIIKSYDDPRIKLVSEADSSHEEAFRKAFLRCEGDFIGSCLSDEELLPHATEEAVRILNEHPRLGAITRDGYNTDPEGKVLSEFIAGDFDFVDYLFGRYCPMWASSFFRRSALAEIGMYEDNWNLGCLEFETWCRLATRSSVRYFPGIVAKYAVAAAGQLSNSPKHFNRHLDNRTKIIEQMFSADGFFGADNVKLVGCLYNQNFLFYNHARAYKLYDHMEVLYDRIVSLRDRLSAAERNEYGVLFSEFGATSASAAALLMQQRTQSYGRAWQVWLRLTTMSPRLLKKVLGPKLRAAIRQWGMRTLFALYSALLSKPGTASDEQESTRDHSKFGLVDPVYSKRIYHDVAMLYYGRGNHDYAQLLWKKAEALNDETVDSLAVQAALFLPGATNESLLARQKHWAARHAKSIAGLPALARRPYRGERKIRVGYFCSFLDSDVFRAMFGAVAKSHDREKFTAIAYSPTPVLPHLKEAFDEVKAVGTMPNREFIEVVRGDEVDIFVEMSGFSPMHRFAAMASRCASIQIAHFNHSGTCGVPNVDYVFADAMSVNADEEPYYSEKVWRLDEDFLFFNYDWAALPEPGPAPVESSGYVTFGCFGSPAKLSDGQIELWSMLLQRVPTSRFYIRNAPLGRRINRDYLEQRFARHGIPASRLWLDGATDWHKFIGSYKDVDISLDTWPYCGANTIGESVWQGVPVVTLRGNRFSSRYGSSHVAAAGTPELIAETPEHYLSIAAELACDPERIARYRRNLRRMAFEHGLSDPVRFARKLEKAYFEMMRISQ